MNKDIINIENLNSIYTTNIYLLNSNISTFNNLIKYLEYLLVDIIDDNMKLALKKYTIQIEENNETLKYYLTGGKAINSIINFKYLNKSFNFDIHLYFDNLDIIQNISSTKIVEFSNNIIDTLKKQFNKDNEYAKYIRGVIFNKLKTYNLVDDKDKEHYISDQLFYYGTRRNHLIKPRQSIINSLFIKLKLKDDLFIKLDKSSVKYTNDFIYSFDTFYNEDNIIYLPFADIGHDTEANLSINKILLKIELIYKYDNIYYSNYFYNLYNLIYYICVAKHKSINLLYINKINNPYNYNLRFINLINKFEIDMYKQIFIPQLKDLNLNIINNNERLFKNENAYLEYINKLKEDIVIINNKSLDKYESFKTIMHTIIDIYLNNQQNILNQKKNYVLCKILIHLLIHLLK